MGSIALSKVSVSSRGVETAGMKVSEAIKKIIGRFIVGKKGNPICITIIITTTVAFLTTILLPIVCFPNQDLHVVLNDLASFTADKRAELLLYKGMLALACVFAGFFAWRMTKSNQDIISNISNSKTVGISERICNIDKAYLMGIVLISMNLLLYLFSKTYSIKLIVMTVVYLYIMLTRKNKIIPYMMCYVGLYYSVTGLYSLYITLFQWTDAKLWLNGSVSQIELEAITVLLFVLLIIVHENFKYKKALEKVFVLSKVLVVFNFCVYFRSSYEYGNEIVHLPYSIGYYAVILCSMILLWWNECKSRENNKREDSQNGDNRFNPSLSMVASILMMNSFIVPAQIVPTDLWHHGEQITGWHQVFDMGQKLYVDFCPSSGCYSIPLGFVLKYICGDTASGYASAYSLLALLICMLVIVLIYHFSGGQIALLVSLFSGMPIYNRGYCILPFLLLLAMPRMIERKSDWLKIWIFGSLIAGVYYPILGVALAVGTLPFAFIQIYDLITIIRQAREGEKAVVSSKKKIYEYASWIIVLGICIGSIPLLVHMAKYFLVLSGQSLDVDAIALLDGSAPPLGFFEWLPYSVRYWFYIFMRLYIPMLAVTVMVTMLVVGIKNKKIDFLRSNICLILTAGVFIQIVAYSYTLIRADDSVLLARTYMTIFPCMIALVIGVLMYGNKYFCKGIWTTAAFIGFLYISLGTITIRGEINFPNTELGTEVGGLINDDMRLMARYKVNEVGFATMDEEEKEVLPKFGNGFCLRSYIKNGVKWKKYIIKNQIENKSFVNLDRFMYYVLDVKACFTDTTHTMEGEEAQEMLIERYQKEKPIFVPNSYEPGEKIQIFMNAEGYEQTENEWLISH